MATCHARIIALLCVHSLLLGDPALGQDQRVSTRPTPALSPDVCGVYLWPGWRPETMNRKTCPLAKGAAIICSWSTLEPAKGRFEFERQIGNKLREADKNGYHVSLAVWTSPNEITPQWLYDAGVPGATFPERITPFKEKKHDRFPYYLDETYQKYFHRLLERTGEYLASLPAAVRSRIAFVEVCEGATGDPAPYYGRKTADFWPEPLDKKYRISRARWSHYRREAWNKYRSIFQNDDIHYPLLVKSADINEQEFAWCLNNLPAIGSKQALFCEYYQHSGSGERLALLNRTRRAIRNAGKSWFTRGEYDAQWKLFGWSTRRPEQSLYWTALCAANAQLDIWQVHYEALQLEKASMAVEFFNRYAGHRDATRAPAAFCALRQGLDAADIRRFPEAKFGKAIRSNVQRYSKIAESYSHRGAMQGDPQKAVGGVMLNRRSEDYNDVGWDILPGNYSRFLSQIHPDETSIGWWHKGPKKSVYGRFARGFHVASGKDAMYFRLADDFRRPDSQQSLTLRVVYLDEGDSSWHLSYHSRDGIKKAIVVTNADSGQWRERTVVVVDAAMQHGGPNESDLILASSGGDTVFHLVEILRADDSTKH